MFADVMHDILLMFSGIPEHPGHVHFVWVFLSSVNHALRLGRLAEGTRKAVEGWGLKLLCKQKRWQSDSLTVIETPQVMPCSAVYLLQARSGPKIRSCHLNTNLLANCDA